MKYVINAEINVHIRIVILYVRDYLFQFPDMLKSKYLLREIIYGCRSQNEREIECFECHVRKGKILSLRNE